MQQAALKGVNNTTMGLIFGVFELILVIMSPVFGNFVSIYAEINIDVLACNQLIFVI
jgi:hypothetical protein